MDAYAFSCRWFATAIFYLVAGVALGVFMGASGDHEMMPVHAHVNLMGWVSMALMGFVYRTFPAAAATTAATWHFWLYQIGTLVLLVAVAAIHLGHPAAEPVAGAASVIVLASVLLFARAFISGRTAA
ncbi:MAG: hypothetical protein GC202_02255 [Alphaproteobacteria bacterium]|nr:hypothetical protein [Alphaproteobacteria bacterium]